MRVAYSHIQTKINEKSFTYRAIDQDVGDHIDLLEKDARETIEIVGDYLRLGKQVF